MSYTNEDLQNLQSEQRMAVSFDDFERLQDSLTNSIKILIDFKRKYIDLYAADFKLGKEVKMGIEDNQINFENKLIALQEQVMKLGEDLKQSKSYFTANIRILSEHLSRLEDKNRGFTDKLKIWNKPKNANDELSRLKQNSTAENTLFSFNDE